MRSPRLPLPSRCIPPVGGRLGLGIGLVSLLVPLLVTAAFGTATAQASSSSSIQISFTASRTELTVGDPVTLTLEIIHPRDHVVVVPRLGRNWGQFEVLSQTGARITVNDAETRTIRQQIDVTLFSTGDFETPTMALTVRKPDGSVEQLATPPVRLTVKSVLSGSDEPLKDIREPADLRMPLWEQPLARAIGLIAIAALCAGGYFVYYRLRGRQEPAVEEETLTPLQDAVLRLDDIESRDLPGAGNFKEHYALVSQVVSGYIRLICFHDDGRAYAREMTTEELEAKLRESEFDARIGRIVTELLKDADAVKFANHMPTTTEAYDALGRARVIIEEATPLFENLAPQGNTRVEWS